MEFYGTAEAVPSNKPLRIPLYSVTPPPDRVEEHFECAFCLGAVCTRKPNITILPYRPRMPRRPLCVRVCLRLDPAGEEDVLLIFRIPREHGTLHACRRAEVANAMGASTKAAASFGIPQFTDDSHLG